MLANFTWSGTKRFILPLSAAKLLLILVVSFNAGIKLGTKSYFERNPDLNINGLPETGKNPESMTMSRHSPTRLRRLALVRRLALATSVTAIALFVQHTNGSWPTFGAGVAYAYTGDVVIDDLKIVDKESTATIRKIEVLGSSLEKAEILKLFATETKPEERAALFAKLQATKFSIPEIQVTGKDDFKGVIRDFLALNIDKGKVAKLTIASFEGGDNAKKGPTNLKVGAIAVDGADVSKLLEAARSGKPPEAADMQNQLDRLSVSNLEMTLPDEKTPKEAPGGNLSRIRIGSLEGLKEPSAGTVQKGSFEVKNFSLEFPKSSTEAASLAEFGYDKIDMGLKIRGSYDEPGKKAVLDEMTVSGLNMGALSLAGKFENVAKTPPGSSDAVKMSIMMASQVSSAQISFANTGLFEKSLAMLAKQQKKKPEDMKAEWGAMAGAMLPAILGGDPAGKTLADALTKFIASPKNVTIGATSKGPAIPLAAFAAVQSPQDVLSKINVTASANQ